MAYDVARTIFLDFCGPVRPRSPDGMISALDAWKSWRALPDVREPVEAGASEVPIRRYVLDRWIGGRSGEGRGKRKRVDIFAIARRRSQRGEALGPEKWRLAVGDSGLHV